VAPGLMVAATDSRHFTALSDHIFRFSPVRAKPEDLARFHGTNERICHRQPGRDDPLLPPLLSTRRTR
jgi:acetylornithine deacetylase/succinyl-diaminopimelate desuccinylase-like protein